MSAFVPGPRVHVAATSGGPLDGLRFAVKDLIDVAGVTTGGGNPDWLATHEPAARHAPCVAKLLAAAQFAVPPHHVTGLAQARRDPGDRRPILVRVADEQPRGAVTGPRVDRRHG